MQVVPDVSPKNVTGLLDKVVGLTYEVVGTVTGQDSWREKGQLQQERGTERLKAVQAEVEAQRHEAEATSAKQGQKSAKKTKESVDA